MNCKKKGCKNPALNERKYCNYHQVKKDERNKMIVNGVVAIGIFTFGLAKKKFFGGSNKS